MGDLFTLPVFQFMMDIFEPRVLWIQDPRLNFPNGGAAVRLCTNHSYLAFWAFVISFSSLPGSFKLLFILDIAESLALKEPCLTHAQL